MRVEAADEKKREKEREEVEQAEVQCARGRRTSGRYMCVYNVQTWKREFAGAAKGAKRERDRERECVCVYVRGREAEVATIEE